MQPMAVQSAVNVDACLQCARRSADWLSGGELLGCAGAHWPSGQPLSPKTPPVPIATSRVCHVARCDLTPEDMAMRARGDCVKVGHLEPMGAQAVHRLTREVNASLLDSRTFFSDFLAPREPVVLRGGAAYLANAGIFSDSYLRSICTLEDGVPWLPTVEINKTTTESSAAGPHSWRRWRSARRVRNWLSFCDFLKRYGSPEGMQAKMYCITPLSSNRRIARHLKLPSVLRCPELAASVREARLWMSRGGTSSSLHWDSHDSILLQLDGVKDFLLWPPNASAHAYVDYYASVLHKPRN